MNIKSCLSRFDGQSKVLVRSLLSGVSGACRALDVFRRQQRTNRDLSWPNLLETLCRDEIICPGKDDQPLAVEALVCLFPALFKQNLLTFIYLIHSLIPKATVLRLLQCLSQDNSPSSWVTALTRQLERNLGSPGEEHLYTPVCHRRLEELSQRLDGATAGWAECFSIEMEESQTAPSLLDLGARKKRKGNFDIQESDEEILQQSKRVKMDEDSGGHVREEEQAVSEEMVEELDMQAEAQENTHHHLPDHLKVAEELEGEAPSEVPAQENSHDFLPEHIKVSALQIKELLESQTEWDQSATDVFKILNNCDPKQVAVLCSMLSLSDLAEQTLPKFCSSILALSPDLSFSTATTLIKNLLLHKVLSLSEPASRSLVTVVMSLCSRYTRSMCHALIGPVLEEESLGSAQAELLNKLIEGCLDSHYTLLVLQMTFKISWSEPMLSIIHTLLDSKPNMNEELFTQLTAQLVRQGPRFTKSVNFAKMLLAILTKYGSFVNATNRNDLSGCLMIHETFLKKSLQAALKRIP
ncbi:Fanconi anemia group E protein [Dunckerocampus dactyliophorus]|uniref:Fanconi anemia group E protein n=1 Tax=Dunckerocampus dactyliophorus TaxID=161453 RepID=UPI0024072659|nr:Fanconi anemia group E protein [Dunckerocampus dactyliophorus]